MFWRKIQWYRSYQSCNLVFEQNFELKFGCWSMLLITNASYFYFYLIYFYMIKVLLFSILTLKFSFESWFILLVILMIVRGGITIKVFWNGLGLYSSIWSRSECASFVESLLGDFNKAHLKNTILGSITMLRKNYEKN